MRIKKDNKIEVGRRMIKRVIKKVYLKIIKSKFGKLDATLSSIH